MLVLRADSMDWTSLYLPKKLNQDGGSWNEICINYSNIGLCMQHFCLLHSTCFRKGRDHSKRTFQLYIWCFGSRTFNCHLWWSRQHYFILFRLGRISTFNICCCTYRISDGHYGWIWGNDYVWFINSTFPGMVALMLIMWNHHIYCPNWWILPRDKYVHKKHKY